jgi:hypothetical protein
MTAASPATVRKPLRERPEPHQRAAASAARTAVGPLAPASAREGTYVDGQARDAREGRFAGSSSTVNLRLRFAQGGSAAARLASVGTLLSAQCTLQTAGLCDTSGERAMRRVLGFAMTALVVGVVVAGPASASTTVAWRATLAEPIGGLYQSPFDCPPDSGCASGSGEVIPLGMAQDLVVFFACGRECDVRALTFDDGSTIVMHEVFSDEQHPGNSQHPEDPTSRSYGHPFSGDLNDTIVGGTGRFAGATGIASGTVKVAGGVATVRLSGTVTF